MQSALQDDGGTHSTGCPSEGCRHSSVPVEHCHLAPRGSVPYAHCSVLTPCTLRSCMAPLLFEWTTSPKEVSCAELGCLIL